MKAFIHYLLKDEQKRFDYGIVHNIPQHLSDLNEAKVGDFIVDLLWDESDKMNKVCISQVIDVRSDKGVYGNGCRYSVIKLSDSHYIVTYKVTKVIPFNEVYI